ncbi:shikimate dehydrogenase [Saccharopolyspora dendranthemae]|uniref:Shikimate dehydrogenase (NADP(+)) n=1 Tax=Saccharopolyspora dendranthemae TaxID=1181886 RepID=A0A561V7A6_9PSEU|nr:shikimate dehydrogenase [Saccharopolyspora dendranthemae]TWG07496.1 shikimate dehydrogenase [Saccharopolyspora dendranthemae]
MHDGYLVGLIGAGIGPSLSPALHEREAAELGLDYRYLRWDLDELGEPPAAVGEVLARARAEGYRGLNITHPCKQLVLERLDEVDEDAAALGAVNTVVFDGHRAIGHNTDHSGFARSFRRGLPDASLERVLLLGAGGAGAAVAHALLGLGAGEVRILDRDAERAAALADSLPSHAVVGGGLADELAKAHGLVHATPTGMAAHPGLPVPADQLRAELWVADVVYRPLETGLVLAARERGCRVLDGGGMAVFQAAGSLRLFTGLEPNAERMVRHFAELEGAHV